MENGRLGALLTLLGLGVVLLIPKVRRRLKAELSQIGEKTRKGYLAAVERFKKGKETTEVAVKPRTRRRKKVAPRVRPVEVMAAQPVPTNAELEGRILDKIKSSPAGKTVTELGAEIGTHFIRLTQPLKRLLEQGRVKKQEKLYFAVA